MRQKVRAAKGRFATRPYSLAENTEKKQKKEKNASRRVAPHRSRSLSQPHRPHIRPRPVPTLTYHTAGWDAQPAVRAPLRRSTSWPSARRGALSLQWIHFCISYGPGFPPCHPILKYYRASCSPVSARSLNLPPTQKKKEEKKQWLISSTRWCSSVLQDSRIAVCPSIRTRLAIQCSLGSVALRVQSF